MRPRPRLTIGTRGPWYLPRALKRGWLRFTMTHDELLQHGRIIGATGTGKSRGIAWFTLSLLRMGYPVTLIDPHGTTAALVLNYLVASGFYRQRDAFDRLLYLDLPAALRQNRFLPFNILAQHERPDMLVLQVRDAFHRAFPELREGAATFDTLLPDALLLLVNNRLPMTELFRLLTDAAFRDVLLEREADFDLVESFRRLYHEFRRETQLTYAGSVLRRARQLTQLDILKYGLAQPDYALDFRTVLAEGQSAIINLALPSDDAKRLLGCFLTVGIEHAAKARSALPYGTRWQSMHAIIDEFELFVPHSGAAFKGMLSETRKFDTFLTVAHQDSAQLPPDLQSSLGNVGYELIFGVEREDAELLTRRIGSVDLQRVKHVVTDPAAVERIHPMYAAMAEQWEEQVQILQRLRRQQAVVSVKNRNRKHLGFLPAPIHRTAKVTVMPLPDVAVDRGELAEVEQTYLSRYFRHQADVAAYREWLRSGHPLARRPPVPRKEVLRV